MKEDKQYNLIKVSIVSIFIFIGWKFLSSLVGFETTVLIALANIYAWKD